MLNYVYNLIQKRGRCQQSILIPGQKLVSYLSVKEAGTPDKVRNSCAKPHVTMPHVAPCKGRLSVLCAYFLSVRGLGQQ